MTLSCDLELLYKRKGRRERKSSLAGTEFPNEQMLQESRQQITFQTCFFLTLIFAIFV
jgi:hypothetical protein